MPIETAFHYLNICAALILAIRLYTSNLRDSYRWFLVLICYETVFGFLAIGIRLHLLRLDYRLLWLCLEPIQWILYFAVCYSLVRRILTDHPGIYSVSKKILIGCFALSALISVLSGQMEYRATGMDDLPVNILLIVDRAVSTGALLVLLLSLGYLLWFPVEVARNVAYLSAGLVVYFASETCLLLARDIWSPQSLRLVSTVLILISTACLVTWIFCLNSVGERVPVRPGHSWKPEEQQRLMSQLDALNAALLRNARP
jgi:hypothetical protein